MTRKQLQTYIIEGALSFDRSGKFPINPTAAALGVDYFVEWEENQFYPKNTHFARNGVIGFTKTSLTSSADWKPFTMGSEDLYSARPVPDKYGIYPYVYTMKVEPGMKVRANDGSIYVCISPIEELYWPPNKMLDHFKKEEKQN